MATLPISHSALNTSGLIFNVRRMSVADGPGARTVIYFKGCPLDCWWCHNPEGQLPAQEVMINEKLCVRCGVCVTNCPLEAITPEECARGTNRETCIVCGTCTANCERGAREMVGRRMDPEEMLAEIEAGQAEFEAAGGGVTFSGGEPLIQHPFLQALLEGCKQRGIHTVVDTSGFAPWEVFESILPYVDLFLYDVKMVDDARHIEYTGVSNHVILENLRRLSEVGHAVILRAPIIAGINDDSDSVNRLCALASGLRLQGVELMPYQPDLEGKYEGLDHLKRLPDLQAPSMETVQGIAECMRHSGLNVSIADGE